MYETYGVIKCIYLFLPVKKLLRKSFNSKVLITQNLGLEFNLSYLGHIYLKGEFLNKYFKMSCLKVNQYFCIHCGMNLV